MPQLDALRAIAVGGVMLHHFLPGGLGFVAYTGVKLFFTLSGFLITGILLRARDDVAEKKSTNKGVLGRFYARRFLRIFPLYYLVIGVAVVLNIEPARQLIGWLLTYTLNIYMARQGWFEAHFAHFWSLAVEEQFYLVWPWVAVLLPRRFLVPAAFTMVATGSLYRLSYILSGYENMTPLSAYISTWSSLDSLGMGALLAMVMQADANHATIERSIRWVLPLSAITAVAVQASGDAVLKYVILDPAEAAAFCCLIYSAGKGYVGALGRLFESKPLRFLGKISYGLYVYHPLMLDFSIFLFGFAGMKIQEYPWQMRVVGLLLTFVVSSLSWHLIEKPINDAKRYF